MEGRDYKYGRGGGRESSRRMLDFSKRQEPDPHLANQDNIRSRFQRLDAGLSHTYFRLGLGGLRASVGKPRLGRPKLGWFSSAFWRTLLGHSPSVSHRRLPSFPRLPPSPTSNGPSHTTHHRLHHPHIIVPLPLPCPSHDSHRTRALRTTSDMRRTRSRPSVFPYHYRQQQPSSYRNRPWATCPPPRPFRAPSSVPIHFAPSGSPASHLCPLPSLPLPQSIP